MLLVDHCYVTTMLDLLSNLHNTTINNIPQQKIETILYCIVSLLETIFKSEILFSNIEDTFFHLTKKTKKDPQLDTFLSKTILKIFLMW